MPLSSEQQQIVVHPADRHAVVLAVAGSGKSTTMAERMAYLVEAKRVDPQHILAVMFNKAASLELEARLQKRLGKRNAPSSVTYHRLGTLSLKWLMRAGKAPDWEFIASPSKAQRFAEGVIKSTCLNYGHKYPGLVAEAFLGFVDRVKSDLLKPAKVWEEGDWDSKYGWFVQMYPQYEKARERAKKRFFSDLIYDPVMIMRSDPDAAKVVADRFEHVIVDEYQDICESQQSLVRFVAGSKARVMVVGDDDQTIYTWRGAKPSYILRDFHRDFPGALTYQLTRTWRYGHALSCAANHVITGNVDRASKLCISGDNTPQTELHLEWDLGDGKKVTEIIEAWIADGGALDDIAILVRTYSRSGAGQFAMLQSGIPFRLEGGDNASVLANKWVVSLIGWLRLAAGLVAERPYAGEPDFGSIMSVRQIIDCPPLGLSREGSVALAVAVLKAPEGLEGFAAHVSTLAVNDGDLATRIMRRGKLWRKVRSLANNQQEVRPIELLEQLMLALDVEKSISRMFDRVQDAEDQWCMVLAFMDYVRSRNGGLREFVRHIDDLQSFSERAKTATHAVHMTSIHRSKGLEWPCVIMLGLAQGQFPLKPKRVLEGEKADKHLEDERRLFYVGMTRVKRKLYLLAPQDPTLHHWLRAGKYGAPPALPVDGTVASQFLYESNLYLSKTVPVVLKRPLSLNVASPELYNQYLQEIGSSFTAAKLID